METTRTLSAAHVLNRTQPTDEPSRRTVDATREQDAVSGFRLLIGGKLVDGAGTVNVINPATGRVLTTAPRADRGQLEQVEAAFPAWAATPLRVRGGLLWPTRSKPSSLGSLTIALPTGVIIHERAYPHAARRAGPRSTLETKWLECQLWK